MKKTAAHLILDRAYISFLNDIKQKVSAARIKAGRSVNKELISLYWEIGKAITEKQKKNRWGDGVVEQLANDLKNEYGNVFGFSVQNLWYMRRFYLEYRGSSILQRLVGELPWGHNILIFSKTNNKKEREYYLKSAVKMGWSRNVLLNQMKAGAYQLSLKQKHHNFDHALPVHLTEQAEESLKSVYNLDFLGITKPVLERELEKRLVEKIKYFILELGAGFSFIGNQYRLELDGDEYFIDLLFFNRKLKCLVAVELKVGDFKPEYAGKMDFYLHLLNDQTKLKDENPPIGIILCARKKHIVVEYALRSAKNPVGVAEYRMTHKLPAPLKNILPSEKQLNEKIKEEFGN